jgi:hypothetical protein
MLKKRQNDNRQKQTALPSRNGTVFKKPKQTNLTDKSLEKRQRPIFLFIILLPVFLYLFYFIYIFLIFIVIQSSNY